MVLKGSILPSLYKVRMISLPHPSKFMCVDDMKLPEVGYNENRWTLISYIQHPIGWSFGGFVFKLLSAHILLMGSILSAQNAYFPGISSFYRNGFLWRTEQDNIQTEVSSSFAQEKGG